MRDLLHDTKQEKENIIYEAKLHWSSYVFPIMKFTFSIILYTVIYWFVSHFFRDYLTELYSIAIFITGFYCIYKLAVILYSIIYISTTNIILTSHTLTLKEGVLSKNITDISLCKYEGIGLHQSFIGRIFNYGTLTISTGEIYQSYNIENPLVLRSHILNLIK